MKVLRARHYQVAKVLALYSIGVLGIVLLTSISIFNFEGKRAEEAQVMVQSGETFASGETSLRFPVGVNPVEKEIVENSEVDAYFTEHVASDGSLKTVASGFLPKIMGRLALMNWYQNLASLSSRVLVIDSGERKEEVSQHFGKILKWNNDERSEFLRLITSSAPLLEEGKFYPGTYTVSKDAGPEEMSRLVNERFDGEVLARYTDDVAALVPLNDALTIASLLEREAYDFEDMRHISGVIWNRLFAGMRLQIDATLQYAKGGASNESWWPQVSPSDKYIASAYNTYKTIGLPPSPIANPSLGAILAALNPKETECMYYFHDRDAGFHCTETYEEHVTLLKEYYGRGK
jgi:cell division protein YceG involved in septum cleavage